LALGAIISSLFLLVYVALIPLLGWAIYRLPSRAGTYSTAWLPVLLGMGCLTILSLLKPLAARPGQAAEPHFLNPDQQPVLFVLVKELAAMGGRPEPAAIAVDCSVNSYTVGAGGAAGLFRSKSTLVVGLPLLAGLHLISWSWGQVVEPLHLGRQRMVFTRCP
jgi:hypothetical protein